MIGTREPGAPSLRSRLPTERDAVPGKTAALNRHFDACLADRLSGQRTDVSFGGEGSFAGSGAIGRYWQTQCRGFEVRSERGRRLGTVEALELDRKTRATVALLVRRRRRKPLRLRPEAVTAVDPWRRLLVVAVSRRRPPAVPVGNVAAQAGRVAGRGRRVARRAGGASVSSAVALGRGVGRTVPRVAKGLAWGAPRALLVLGLALWVYALVVFAVVRVVAWLLAALTVGTARGGARLKPHLHGAK